MLYTAWRKQVIPTPKKQGRLKSELGSGLHLMTKSKSFIPMIEDSLWTDEKQNRTEWRRLRVFYFALIGNFIVIFLPNGTMQYITNP